MFTADSAESTELLIRTAEDGLGTPHPIQQLRLENSGQDSPEDFWKLATLLIGRCTEI